MLARLLDRYLPPAYWAIFKDEFTWRDNPVLRREQLREGRRRDRALLLLTMLGTMVGLFVVAEWLLSYFYDQQLTRSRPLYVGRVPPVLGGGYPVFFFALFSVIHYWFVWHSSYRRSYYLLLQEYRQNSLATLLCTRIPPFQLLLMASLHPFRQGMLAAAVGLPFYAWIMGLGGVTPAEFAGLFLLFAMISFRPPRWSLPVFGGIPAEEIMKRQRTGRPKTWGEWWLFNGFWICLIGSWYLQWAFGPNWLSKLLWPLTELFTPNVTRILPGFVVTWVLALVRFLWTPLPYYGFHLPPIAVVFPLYLFARFLGIWESSLHLRTGDADTTQPLWDLREYWRMRRIYGVLLPFLLLGFLWKPYVSSGLSSVLLVVLGGQKDVAIAGLLYLVGFLAALVCWARAREMSAIRLAHGGKLMGLRDDEAVERSLAWEAWYVLSPLVTVYGLYVTACLLAGAGPLPAPAARVLAPLLLMALAGSYYARGIPPGQARYVTALLLPLTGWFLPIPEVGGYLAAVSPLAGLLSLSEHTQRIISTIPTVQSHVAPWYVSFLAAGLAGFIANVLLSKRARTRAPGQLVPASLLGGTPSSIPSAVALQRASAGLPPPAPQIEAVPLPIPAVETAVDAQQYATAQETTVDTVPLKTKAFARKADTPVALRLISWLQSRWDNALAVKELRVLLRGHLGRDEQITFSVVLLGFLLAALYRADISSAVLEGPARLLFGSAVAGGGPIYSGGGGGVLVVFGGMAAVLLLVMSFAATAAVIGVCGTAFGRERDKSTLGFVLATPLPTRSILLGKFLGMIAPTLLAVSLVAFWSALLCLPVSAELGVVQTLAGLLFAVLNCLLLVFLGGSLALALSTLLRREADSTSLAFLLLFFAIGGVGYMTFAWPHLLAGGAVAMVPGQWIWLGYLAIADAILVTSALSFAQWRLNRARHGDVAFESATK